MTLKISILAALLSAALVPAARAAESLPKHGDFIAMGGDSITYMSRYSLYVEAYLLATRPDLDLRVMKIQRWCGGTADNYSAETLEQELIPAKPNIFTICFGMNDGGGGELSPDTEHRYEAALTRIVERNQANGTVTVVCSPGVVDTFSYENPEFTQRLLKATGGATADPTPSGERIAAIAYNRTLGGLGDVGRRVAAKYGVPFADIHNAMFDVLQAGVEGYGKSWPPRTSLRRPDRRALICDDGIHPDTAAHIPMAYAVLRAMGFDGDIGSIDFDWAKGSVRTDAAQTAAVASKNRLELASTRLPMCFFDDSACGEGYPSVPVRYLLQHCPFNQDLNRYALRVIGLPNQPVRVTWGDRSLVFTREQLQAGVNLAAEFPENPFCPTMHALDRAIWQKQVFERNLFAILNIPIWNKHFEGAKAADRSRLLGESLAEFSKWSAGEFSDNQRLLDACNDVGVRALQDTASVTPMDLSDIRRTMFERDRDYHQKARALVKPVHHVLTIEPISP